MSPTGGGGSHRHGKTMNRLRDALHDSLPSRTYALVNDLNVVHERKVWIPDLFVAPRDDEEHITEDGLGIDASAVEMIFEIVSPGRHGTPRDRVRKRRGYARAGIPIYVLIDDYDGHGTVSVLTAPSPGEGVYAAETRVP